ncbi:MAG: hypothetical protein MUF81_19855, partial [Verrucomicrobia bacterium]|nr:hypothetical protein [Verrucomicrobiota bacterium]
MAETAVRLVSSSFIIQALPVAASRNEPAPGLGGNGRGIRQLLQEFPDHLPAVLEHVFETYGNLRKLLFGVDLMVTLQFLVWRVSGRLFLLLV